MNGMTSFQRAQVPILLDRLKEAPRQLIALLGPRQTGKTTIVRQALARLDTPYRYLAVDDPALPRIQSLSPEARATPPVLLPGGETAWLLHHWEEARQEAERSQRGFVLAIDEIQKVPGWSETVKGLWDADRARNLPLHVIILGSAPLLVQSGLAESLAGRFELIPVTHWSFQEMASAFNFDLPMYVYFGGYPGAAMFLRDEQRWRDYILGSIVEPNIERDILSMTRVDKPALLKQLFELGSSYSGQILSFTKMVGQLQDAGNTTTLARYLELLSSAGLLTGLQNWANQNYRRRASSPKLTVLNTALMTAGSGYSFAQARADRTLWGRIVESAVGAHLINTATTDIRVHYWRDRSLEVDFVIRRGSMVVAIEVSGRQHTHTRKGTEEFKRRYRTERTLLVGNEGIPISEFLSGPAAQWFERQ